jgi:hypothetical protein
MATLRYNWVVAVVMVEALDRVKVQLKARLPSLLPFLTVLQR